MVVEAALAAWHTALALDLAPVVWNTDLALALAAAAALAAWPMALALAPPLKRVSHDFYLPYVIPFL